MRDDIRHQAISQYQPVAISATSRAKAPELNHPKKQMEEKAEGRQMKKQKCQKCGAKKAIHFFECGSKPDGFPTGFQFKQSDLCKERVKVARLKKQVEKLKGKLQTAENLAFNLDCTLIKAREMIQELETKKSEVRR